MNVGDRVTVTHNDWAGTVEAVRANGRVDVALDGGGRALGMDGEHVKPQKTDEERDRERESQRAKSDKGWPPKTLETKVPRQTGEK